MKKIIIIVLFINFITYSNAQVMMRKVFAPPPLSVSDTAIANVSCHGGSNGNALATVSGGISPYTYSWSNGKTIVSTSNPTGAILTAGSYTVTVTDANSNTITDTVNITQPDTLSFFISKTHNVECHGGSDGIVCTITTGGTSPYTYSWANSNTNRYSITLTAGSYTLTVIDSCGTTKTASATVYQPDSLSVTVVDSANVSCYGGNNGIATSILSGGTSPYKYRWSDFSTGTFTTGLSTGTYSLSVTDSCGAVATASVTITQPMQLIANSYQLSAISCFGESNGSAQASVTGGVSPYTYKWSDASSQTAITVTGLSAGTYSVNVEDTNGCSVISSITITQPSLLSDTIGYITNIDCHGNSTGTAVAYPATGGTPSYSYQWTPSGGTDLTATGLSAGSYTLTVTDVNKCTASASIVLTQPTALSSSIKGDTICQGDNTILTANASGGTPGYTYLWSAGGTTSSVLVSPPKTATFSITILDNNGCSTTAKGTVTVNPLPKATLSAANDTSCLSWTSVLLHGSPKGGSYSGAGVTDTVFNPATAGVGLHILTYTFTDSLGCTDTAKFPEYVSVCAGVKTISNPDNNITFYPDPFTQNIDINVNLTGQVILNMYNMLGEKLGTYTIKKGNNVIGTENLPSGIYLMQVITENGEIQRKIVKAQ
jgi:hypothetical protein